MEVGSLCRPLRLLLDLFRRLMENFCGAEPAALKINQAEDLDT